MYICHNHFIPGDVGKKYLKAGAIPALNLNISEEENNDDFLNILCSTQNHGIKSRNKNEWDIFKRFRSELSSEINCTCLYLRKTTRQRHHRVHTPHTLHIFTYTQLKTAYIYFGIIKYNAVVCVCGVCVVK